MIDMHGPSIALEFALAWRLVLAAAFGAALGLERSLAGKHAGMRTYALVSLGSAMFVILGNLASEMMLGAFPGVNPLQIAGSVVLGVGFLGTGLSVFRGDHPVELTTAAGLWVAAGVGMAAGFGFTLLALCGAILAVILLSVFLHVENSIRSAYVVAADPVEVKAKTKRVRPTKRQNGTTAVE
jgi:putative Mg2+ transporter-C (MgtC) family protein